MLLHEKQKQIAKVRCRHCTAVLDHRNKTGDCKTCYPKHRKKMSKEEKLAYQYKWRKQNPKKHKATQKRTYLKNRKSLLKRAWKSQIKRKYGISVEQYELMFLMANKRCQICKLPSSKKLAVDHCHTTGKVRGLLCAKCNLSLGGFNDDVEMLLTAIEYLRKYDSA